MDLGAWATEKYRIAKPHDDADEPLSSSESGDER